MSSRALQIKALEQKIERLTVNLEYLKKLDEIESRQTEEVQTHEEN